MQDLNPIHYLQGNQRQSTLAELPPAQFKQLQQVGPINSEYRVVLSLLNAEFVQPRETSLEAEPAPVHEYILYHIDLVFQAL